MHTLLAALWPHDPRAGAGTGDWTLVGDLGERGSIITSCDRHFTRGGCGELICQAGPDIAFCTIKMYELLARNLDFTHESMRTLKLLCLM